MSWRRSGPPFGTIGWRSGAVREPSSAFSASASETRSLAGRVQELIAAVDVEGSIGVNDFIESQKAQNRAVRRMVDAFHAPIASFGRCVA